MTDGCVPGAVRELSRAGDVTRDIAVEATTGSVRELTDPVHVLYGCEVSVRVVRPSVVGPSPYSTAAM